MDRYELVSRHLTYAVDDNGPMLYELSDIPPMNFFQIIVSLQTHPELLARAEVLGKPHGGVSAYCAFSQHDFVDPARRHTDFACQAILAKAHRLEKLLEQHFAGMNVG